MPIIILLISLTAFAKILPIEMDDAKAFYIVDGDSISLSMRIKGIDAPEKNQPCGKFLNETQNCNLIAKQQLQVFLNDLPGKLLVVPVGIEHYGRVLVRVYKGGVDVGEMMVEAGMAYAYGSEYKTKEAFAKKHKKGFWGYEMPPIEPKIWRKQHRRNNFRL